MAYSGWSNTATSGTRVSGTWIQDPLDPENNIVHFRYGGVGRQESRDRAKTAMQFAGRSLPVYEVGEARAYSVSVSAQINGEEEDAEDQITKSRDFGENARVVLYRDGYGRRFYGMMDSFQLTNVGKGSADVSFQVSAVDYDEALPGVS